MFYKKVVSMAAALAFFGMLATTSAAQAQTVTTTSGKIINVNAAEDVYAVELSQAGRCGSKQFIVPRTFPNFKEIVAVATGAYLAGKGMAVFVTGCSGTGNLISENIGSWQWHGN